MLTTKKLKYYSETEELRNFFINLLPETYSYFLFTELFIKSKEHVFLTKEDDKLVGAIVGMKECNNIGTIAMLGVLKEYRSKGLGRRLLRVMLEVFLYEGVEYVYVDTEESNKVAVDFYKSVGFVIIDYFEKYYSNCNAAFRLRINLKEYFN